MYHVPATLLIAVSLVMSAHAQDAKPKRDAHTNTASSASAERESRNCLRSTGSLIPAAPGQCLPVAGHSYDQQDLRRTGAFTTAEALGRLDPGITVHGH